MTSETERRRGVAWAELLPGAFEARLQTCPVVYLPLGLCEPHGPGAALGLDLIKAEGICALAASRHGGIVAPSLGYHIHESGYHARWLEDVIGEDNPRMTSVPPTAMLLFFLFQLRAFLNAGFRGAMVLSGHAGGNEDDLRLAAAAFAQRFHFAVTVRTDAELASPRFRGDHAGLFEISQLMHLRPDLVDAARIAQASTSSSPEAGLPAGRFALGDDADQASARHGQQIIATIVDNLGPLVAQLAQGHGTTPPGRIGFEEVEALWLDLHAARRTWTTAHPKPGQQAVSADSQWKPYERLA